MSTLRTISPELNRITDEANALVQKVESLLASLSLGIPAAVHVRRESTCEAPDSQGLVTIRAVDVYLEYRRIDKKFGLAVVRTQSTRRQVNPDDGSVMVQDLDVTPWASCSRDLKLESFAKVPDLIAAIAEKAGGYIERVKAAGDTVRELVKALEEHARAVAAPSDEQLAMMAKLPEDKLREIEDHMRAGRGMVAIKIFREYTGVTIAEAKDAVERIAPNITEEAIPAADKTRRGG